MIKLNRLTDYAVVITAEMSKQNDCLATPGSLSQNLQLNEPTISKILKLLAAGGLIQSKRGAKGGYCLQRPVNQIKIVDVIEIMDGPIAVTACSDATNQTCQLNHQCCLKTNWQILNTKIRDAIKDITVADMMAK